MHLPRKLTNKIRKNYNKNLILMSEYITTSFNVYMSRNKKRLVFKLQNFIYDFISYFL